MALGGRALALVRGLPDNSLIDRLVRGRAWIPVLGLLLAGIVAMQVEILKLGASMGRAMERSAILQTQNESLQASVATLGDDQRIERLAAGMGMVMPVPGSLVFLSAHPGGDVGRAIANIHAPDPTGFIAQLAAQAAALAALAPSPPSTIQGSTSAGTLSPGTTSSSSPALTTPTASSTTAASNSTTAATTSTAPTAGSSSTTGPTVATDPASGSVAPTSSSGAGAPTGAAGVAPAATAPSSASASGGG